MAASVSVRMAVLAPVEKYPEGVGEAVGMVTLVRRVVEAALLTDATTEAVLLLTGAKGPAVFEGWNV